MDPSADLSALIDSLTAQTSGERFSQEFLATPSAFPPSLPITAFDMPLLAHHSPSDPLSPSALLPPPTLDLPALLPPAPHYTLPGSAVTGPFAPPDLAPALPIRKKRARPAPRPKPEALLALSAASDVSSLPIPRPSAPAKQEPAPLPAPRPRSTSPSSAASRHNPPAPASTAHAQAKSHTRKCREKVTKHFENLLEVLPRPPQGVEVKHKAQVLEYTINVFRYLLLRRTFLHAEIALASKPALKLWMDSTIAAATSPALPRHPRKKVPFAAVLEPFVGLYCVKKGWTYGEMWLVDDANHAFLASCVFNTDDDAVLKKFDTFATMSRSQYNAPSQVKSGIVNRVLASKRPEWLNDLPSDPTVFDRAPLAAELGLCVAEAVPVMLDNKRCAGVLLFADVAPHNFSTGDMITLLDYASTLSSFYMEYLSQADTGVYPPRAAEPKLEAKPIRIAEPALGSQDRTATSRPTTEPFPQAKQPMLGVASLHGFLPPSSETSSSLFGESDFVGTV